MGDGWNEGWAVGDDFGTVAAMADASDATDERTRALRNTAFTADALGDRLLSSDGTDFGWLKLLTTAHGFGNHFSGSGDGFVVDADYNGATYTPGDTFFGYYFNGPWPTAFNPPPSAPNVMWPDPTDGWVTRRERYIQRLDNAGSDGENARFVATTTGIVGVKTDASEYKHSGKVFTRTSGVWVLAGFGTQPDSEETPVNNAAFVTPFLAGTVIDVDLLNLHNAALNLLTATAFAVEWLTYTTATNGGTPTSYVQADAPTVELFTYAKFDGTSKGTFELEVTANPPAFCSRRMQFFAEAMDPVVGFAPLTFDGTGLVPPLIAPTAPGGPYFAAAWSDSGVTGGAHTDTLGDVTVYPAPPASGWSGASANSATLSDVAGDTDVLTRWDVSGGFAFTVAT